MASKNNKLSPARINIKNKRAEFDYLVVDRYTAGIVLTGTEIKSIREGKAGLTDTYCYIYNGELWVKNMYISEYSLGSYNNHSTRRDRKLLLNKKEIRTRLVGSEMCIRDRKEKDDRREMDRFFKNH